MGVLKKGSLLSVKWLWRFSRDHGNLWHSTILSKYGSHSNKWDVNSRIFTSMSLTWKNIISLLPLFLPFVRFSVGRGDSIRFWKYLWWGDQCLSFSFPRLFRLAIHKHAKVSESIFLTKGNPWTIYFSRDLYDWEVDQLGNLMMPLKDAYISSSFPDSQV